MLAIYMQQTALADVIFRCIYFAGVLRVNIHIYLETLKLYICFIFRKDFRLLRGTPGDPSKPEVHPVFWLKKEAKYMVDALYFHPLVIAAIMFS